MNTSPQSELPPPLTIAEERRRQRVIEIQLVIEHRHCRQCSAVHIVPNPHLLAKVWAGPGASTKASALSKLHESVRATVRKSTPCARLHVHTHSEACHLCFDDYEPDDQLELFTSRAEPEPEGLDRWRRPRPEPTTPTEKPKLVRSLSDY